MKPLTPTSPHAIIMVGIPGSGKSTFAERFASTFGAPFINSTVFKYQLSLSDAQTAALQSMVLHELLKTQRTLLIEGATHKRAQRTALVNAITKAGLRPLIVWVQTDPGEARRRAVRPLPKGSGLTNQEFDSVVAAFQPPAPAEAALVISGKHTYATQLKVVLKHIANEPRPLTTEPAQAARPTPPAARPRGITVR